MRSIDSERAGVRRRFASRAPAGCSETALTRGDRFIPTLDGWRAIAILLVLVAHTGAAILPRNEYFRHPSHQGGVGVSIFFCISGYLITRLLLGEFQIAHRLSLRGFYIRRTFRILPPLLVLVAFLAAVGMFRSQTELLGCVFFFRNYLDGASVSFATNHIWSLSVEEHFYLLWPALLGWLLHRRLARGPLVLTMALAFTAWKILDSKFHWIARAAPVLDTQFRTDYRLDYLLAGCALATLLNDEAIRGRAMRLVSSTPFLAVVGAFAVLVLRPVGIVGYALPYVIAAMIGCTVLRPELLTSQWLDSAPLRWTGKLSYSLYLWQQIFLVPSWEQPAPALTAIQPLPWAFAAIAAASVLSYYAIERPAIAIGRKLSSPRTATGISASNVASRPATGL